MREVLQGVTRGAILETSPEMRPELSPEKGLVELVVRRVFDQPRTWPALQQIASRSRPGRQRSERVRMSRRRPPDLQVARSGPRPGRFASLGNPAAVGENSFVFGMARA